MRLQTALLRTVALLSLGGPVLAVEFVLDDFAVSTGWHLGRDPLEYGLNPALYPTWVPVPVPGMATVTDTDPAGIFGGTRDINLTRSAGYTWSPTVDYSTWQGGAFTFNSSWDDAIASWSLTYGGHGDLNLDMTGCGNDRLRIYGAGQFETYTNGTGNDTTPCTVSLVTGSGTGIQTQQLRGNMDQSPTFFDFPLSGFTTCDLTDVDRIVIAFGYLNGLNEAVDYGISEISLPFFCEEEIPVGAEEQAAAFHMAQNVPNPFNPVTLLSFTLEESAQARLVVHDLAGRQVALLVDGLLERGTHDVSFDGSGLPSGVYLYTLEALGWSRTEKMLLVK